MFPDCSQICSMFFPRVFPSNFQSSPNIFQSSPKIFQSFPIIFPDFPRFVQSFPIKFPEFPINFPKFSRVFPDFSMDFSQICHTPPDPHEAPEALTGVSLLRRALPGIEEFIVGDPGGMAMDGGWGESMGK